jgi:hypothetical protein
MTRLSPCHRSLHLQIPSVQHDRNELLVELVHLPPSSPRLQLLVLALTLDQLSDPHPCPTLKLRRVRQHIDLPLRDVFAIVPWSLLRVLLSPSMSLYVYFT